MLWKKFKSSWYWKEKEEKIKENTARDTEAVLKEYEDTLGF